MQLELTEAEAQHLLEILDIAVRAVGLKAAQAAMPIVNKLTTAQAAAQPRVDAASPGRVK